MQVKLAIKITISQERETGAERIVRNDIIVGDW